MMGATVFVRLIEAEDKGQALASALGTWRSDGRAEGVYEADARSFGKVPGSPFAYWVGEEVRDLFEELPPLASEGREVKVGLQTSDDFRFLRLWWEIEPGKKGQGRKWVPFAKGGEYSPYYADIHLCLNWGVDGYEIKAWAGSLYNRSHWSRIIKNVDFYFRAGLTWPLRTNGLSFRYMPAGCIFGHKGPVAFVRDDSQGELASLCGFVNSQAFGGLVATQLARTELAQSFEVGLVGATPVPALDGEPGRRLADAAGRGWRSQYSLDRMLQTSHAFTLPFLRVTSAGSLRGAFDDVARLRAKVAAELSTLEEEVTDEGFDLLGLTGTARESISGQVTAAGEEESDDDLDEDQEVDETADASALMSSLLEWTVGVAVGRFDIRLATGERPIPEDPDPFDPLPVCSPGMLQDEEGFPATASPPGYRIEVAWDGILVDDEGHPRDIARHIRRVLSEVSDGHDWATEAEEILGRDLRSWVQRFLFEDHIKRYSKSRRKAPIFWRLGTTSGSYSVWLYYPRATGDTLYRVLNDYVEPKLRHEEGTLLRLRQDAGASPTASQQKRIEAQETLVSEVQDMRGELEVVAQLWRPEFDDGVVLNFAPFWRLVAHTRKWQQECQKHWEKLMEGEYDWSYTAMRLWPERVVPACAEDRSFAIAHGLEQELFPEKAEGDYGGASNVRESDRIQKLVDARSSAAVKQALQTLLER